MRVLGRAIAMALWMLVATVPVATATPAVISVAGRATAMFRNCQ